VWERWCQVLFAGWWLKSLLISAGSLVLFIHQSVKLLEMSSHLLPVYIHAERPGVSPMLLQVCLCRLLSWLKLLCCQKSVKNMHRLLLNSKESAQQGCLDGHRYQVG
jgi:hypothetical protein